MVRSWGPKKNGANSANSRDGEHVKDSSQKKPTPWDKSLCAVGRFRSLNLSRPEAQYLTPQLATDVTWPDVYDILRQLAQPAPGAFDAADGNGTII